ncbi:hypothetical protein HHK36_018512 [Tetracentron sinense]|uniref:Reticulon-like protein n=1 Tax=Tetracentron sinense TaxID=13715 RepID=A0A834Z4I8_TETSI|nr:hypothetical protein HHK36_018512 [Tetracentron sinense]
MQPSKHGRKAFVLRNLSLSKKKEMGGFTLLGWILRPPTPPILKAWRKAKTAFSATHLKTTGFSYRDSKIDFSFELGFRFSIYSSWIPLIDCLTDRELFIRSSEGDSMLYGLLVLLELVADIVLWRQRNVALGILFVILAAWMVFERSGYTLLSFVSNVLLLLISILFLWAKSSALLSRPAPPLPDLHLPEAVINEAAAICRSHVNALLSVSRDIALGKDSMMFVKVAACLSLISIVGGRADFLTLAYTSLLVVLTIPALYERYEDQIDRYLMMGYRKLQRLYVKLDVEFASKIKKWILEKRKLS